MMLSAHALTHAYPGGAPVLHAVSLTLERGMVAYLLGRNGSGKSTLMGCLSGAITPDSGEVHFDGVPIAALSPAQRARRIGLIPQVHTPVFAYSAREIVLMGRAPYLSAFGVPGARDRAIADAALEQVGMEQHGSRAYTQLSGGERQLVLIARGLAQQCAVLLMDEPDAHLDLNNQQRVMAIVRRLAGEGVSFIIASHVPNNALHYADRVLLMKHGRVITSGTPEQALQSLPLSEAYDMLTEVIYETRDGVRIPRAIVPGLTDEARLRSSVDA
jgi:iron complex transport system ATP-binding protein